MDVKKLFTPDLVRSLMDTSRPEAEQRLRRTLALKALAAAEKIEVSPADLEAKLSEIRQGLSDSASIDPQRLRLAVAEDLLREQLLEWLEANSTITDKLPAADDGPAGEEDAPGKAAADGPPAEAAKPAAKTRKRSSAKASTSSSEQDAQPQDSRPQDAQP
jgi:trigger factor